VKTETLRGRALFGSSGLAIERREYADPLETWQRQHDLSVRAPLA
jgi:hypothetical protein